MKKVVVLGSTGSVGKNALDVLARCRDKFKVVGLTAGSNVELLSRQTKLFKPRLIALGDISRYNELKKLLGRPQKVLKDPDGLSEVAAMPEADIVVVAVSGTKAISVSPAANALLTASPAALDGVIG